MNERIRELAEQAQGPRPRIHGEWTLTNAELELFAELIVRECIRIDIENPDAAPGAEIAEYFGVE